MPKSKMRYSNNRRNSNNSRNRSNSGCKNNQSRNFQDKFAKREYQKGKDAEREEEAKSFGNDPAWYNRFPEISIPANSVTYSWPMGQFIDVDPNINIDSAFVMPGVLRLDLAPTFGYSDSGTSPLNIATQDLYSTVRKTQTGATNYDPQDMMLYTISMSQVYSYITFLQRIYGSMFISTLENRYTPVTLVTAQGANYSSLLNNLADFRSGLNQLIVSASAFNVPASIEYFRRQAFLYRDIYIEGTSLKQAMYLYNPASFFIYSEGTTASAAGQLTHKRFTPPAGGYTYDQLLNFGFDLLSPLKGSQDAGVISGDLGKSFDGNLVTLQYVDDTFRIELQYSEEVLQQFRNATIININSRFDTAVFDRSALFSPVTQNVEINNSYLVHTPTVVIDCGKASGNQLALDIAYYKPYQAYFEGKKILNTMPNYANPAGTSVATRLMSTTSPFIFEDNGSKGEAKLYAGTEVAVGMYAYVLNDDMTGVTPFTVDGVINTVDTASVPSGAIWPNININRLTALAARSAFHYAPFTYNYYIDGSSLTDVFLGVIGDFDTYTVVDTDTVRQMHRSAIYSLMMP